MTAFALALVLLSSVAHSTWNLLLKRSGDKEVFVWLMLVCGGIILSPLGAALLWLYPIRQPGWWLALGTVALHVLYFLLLGRGYARGDLSLVYPIARGLGPMLVPALAALTLRESMAWPAALGVAWIVAGIYVVSWWGQFRRLLRRPLALLSDGGTRYALLTGLTITVYSLVDKRGVAYVQPFLYMYLMTAGAALGLAPYILRNRGIGLVRREWRENALPIVVAGLLTFLAYGLVLTALSISP